MKTMLRSAIKMFSHCKGYSLGSSKKGKGGSKSHCDVPYLEVTNEKDIQNEATKISCTDKEEKQDKNHMTIGDNLNSKINNGLTSSHEHQAQKRHKANVSVQGNPNFERVSEEQNNEIFHFTRETSALQKLSVENSFDVTNDEINKGSIETNIKLAPSNHYGTPRKDEKYVEKRSENRQVKHGGAISKSTGSANEAMSNTDIFSCSKFPSPNRLQSFFYPFSSFRRSFLIEEREQKKNLDHKNEIYNLQVESLNQRCNGNPLPGYSNLDPNIVPYANCSQGITNRVANYVATSPNHLHSMNTTHQPENQQYNFENTKFYKNYQSQQNLATQNYEVRNYPHNIPAMRSYPLHVNPMANEVNRVRYNRTVTNNIVQNTDNEKKNNKTIGGYQSDSDSSSMSICTNNCQDNSTETSFHDYNSCHKALRRNDDFEKKQHLSKETLDIEPRLNDVSLMNDGTIMRHPVNMSLNHKNTNSFNEISCNEKRYSDHNTVEQLANTEEDDSHHLPVKLGCNYNDYPVKSKVPLIRSVVRVGNKVSLRPRRSKRNTKCNSEREKHHETKQELHGNQQQKSTVRATHQAFHSHVSTKQNEKISKHLGKYGDVHRKTDSQAAPQNRNCIATDSPSSYFIFGKKVTMVDREKKVFVIDLLTSGTCNLIRSNVNDHIKKVNESDSSAPTWRTLYTYTKMDLPCGEVEGMANTFTNRIIFEISRIVGEVYGKPEEACKLRARSWKEPHFLRYQKIENEPEHTGVQMHYDGCDITFILSLSDISEYKGGGTYIRCLRKTINLRQGQAVIFPGELYHKGVDIVRGVRSLIVCFLDGFDPKIYDDSKDSEKDREYEKIHNFLC